MTLDDVLDLFDYWREAPPVQWMVQAYLGVKPKSQQEEMAPDEFRALVQSMSPGNGHR